MAIFKKNLEKNLKSDKNHTFMLRKKNIFREKKDSYKLIDAFKHLFLWKFFTVLSNLKKILVIVPNIVRFLSIFLFEFRIKKLL